MSQMVEKEKYQEMVARREKCLNFLLTTQVYGGLDDAVGRVSQVDLVQRFKEISEWESLLGELWNRLEIDIRKGDPSLPLKLERTPVENWYVERVQPFLVWAELAEIWKDYKLPTQTKT